jgi:hypothetical protein
MQSSMSSSPRYHDNSQEISISGDDCGVVSRFPTLARFPLKLHAILRITEEEGHGDIISWQIHGRAFKIHKTKEFEEKVLKKYFNHTKLNSFNRQLSHYGFSRISQGRDYGAYYHEFFLRGKSFLTKNMFRQKIKGDKMKLSLSSEAEPDFYTMPFMAADDCCTVTTDYDNLEFHDKKARNKPKIHIQPEKIDYEHFLDEGDFDTFSLIDYEPFLDEGDFDTFSFDSNSSFMLMSDCSCIDSLHETDKRSKKMKSFMSDPDAISLEMREVAQRYSIDECNLILGI